MDSLQQTNEDIFLKYKFQRDKERINLVEKPFNIKVGYNLFQFHKYDVSEDEWYNKNKVIQLGQCTLFSEFFFGGIHPTNCLINVSIPLFKRMSSLIIEKHKSFNEAPVNICFLIRRYDNYDKIQDAKLKARGIFNKRGRVKYLIGLINEEEFNKLSNWIKYGKDKEKLEYYLTE